MYINANSNIIANKLSLSLSLYLIIITVMNIFIIILIIFISYASCTRQLMPYEVSLALNTAWPPIKHLLYCLLQFVHC